MSRALVLLVALLLAPAASAQMTERAVPAIGRGEMKIDHGAMVDLRVETVDPDRAPMAQPWLLVGVDNVLNLTVRHGSDQPWNGSFRLNASGATVTPDVVRLQTAGRGAASALVTVHPDDMGVVRVVLESIDAFYPGGEPMTTIFEAPAFAPPSVRLVDPAVEGVGAEVEEYRSVDMYGGIRSPWTAFIRIPPGEGVRVKVEVRNPLQVTTPEFAMTLTGGPRDVGPIDVPSLGPGEVRVIELPEWMPVEQQGNYGNYYGPMGRFEGRIQGRFSLGGAETTVHLAAYSLERGAVTQIIPATITVEVQEGLAIELLVPRDPRLGTPTRVKVNLSNDGREVVKGSLVVMLQTPQSLFYEVQGPESKAIAVNLAPGERAEDAIEFTPRVTGHWSIQTLFRSGEGYGYGGGGGAFEIPSPVRITLDQQGIVYARIGDEVSVDLSVETEKTLQDAKLRLTTGTSSYGGFERDASSGAFRPGLLHRLLKMEATTSSLGTLQPGGVVNTTVQVKARASGAYSVVPYVLAEGFAYTAQPPDQSRGDVPMYYGPYGGGGMQLAVQTRGIAPPFALAPLTLGLALFMGAWFLRTRWVK